MEERLDDVFWYWTALKPLLQANLAISHHRYLELVYTTTSE